MGEVVDGQYQSIRSQTDFIRETFRQNSDPLDMVAHLSDDQIEDDGIMTQRVYTAKGATDTRAPQQSYSQNRQGIRHK